MSETAEQYEAWAAQGFDKVDELLGDAETDWVGENWQALQGEFLAGLGLGAGDLESYPVIKDYLSRLDDMSPDERGDVLRDDGKRKELLGSVFAESESVAGQAEEQNEQEGADEQADATEQYVDGRGWMRWDPNAGTWIDIDGPGGEPVAPESEGAESEADETVNASVTEIGNKVREAVQSIPGIEALSDEQIQALITGAITSRGS